MSIEKVKDLAQLIQAIVLSLAVLVGGGWTLYKYNQSQELNLKRLEYENLLTEDKIKQPVINIGVEANYIANKYLYATATLNNTGVRDVNILLNKNFKREEVKPWRIGVYQKDDHTYDYLGVNDVYLVENPNEPKNRTEAVGNVYLKAGATQKLSLIYPISKSGIYSVEFRGIPSPDQYPAISYDFFGQKIINIVRE